MTIKHSEQSGRFSRRKFIASVAAVAAAASIPGVASAQRPRDRAPRFVIREDRFGRMFPDLDPFFRENSTSLQNALRDIGKLGGMLDAGDELGDGGKQAAIDLIVDPTLSANNPNNAAHTAGITFLGQFEDQLRAILIQSGVKLVR